MKKHHSAAWTIAAGLLLAGASYASGTHSGGHADYSGADTAVGKPGVATASIREVKVEMTDAMRFNPAHISVKQNETVRLVVTNGGKLRHELVLGTEKELKDHNEAMKKNPEMEHDDPGMLTLDAGKTGEIVWQFPIAGKVNFACLQAGHYEAGMKGAIQVAPKATGSSKAHAH